MKLSLWKLLRGFDSFGHPVNLSYRGEGRYTSVVGAILSITIQILALILAVQALEEVVQMQSPTITSFTRPLTQKGKEELASLDLGEHDYVLAFSMRLRQRANGRTFEHAALPREVGRIAAYRIGEGAGSPESLRLSRCDDLLTDETVLASSA